MTARILMPEAGSYSIAILVLNALGSSSLAAKIHRRWGLARQVAFAHIYLAIMAGITFGGAVVFDYQALVGKPQAWPLAVLYGILGGYLATHADRAIIRFAKRRRPGWLPFGDRRGTGLNLKPSLPAVIPSVLPSRQGGRVADNALDLHGFSRWSLLATGALEEVVHRGWILEACRLLPDGMLRSTAIVGSLFTFALLHLHFGWPHVLAKAPLGGLSLVGVLLTGSVVAAVITHVWFNARVWNDQRSNLFLVGGRF